MVYSVKQKQTNKMQRIQQHIKKVLKGDSDLMDSVSIVDNSLTYSENKAEIEPYIDMLMDTTQKQKECLKSTKKGIVEENNHYDQESFKLVLKGFWHSLHKKQRYKLK